MNEYDPALILRDLVGTDLPAPPYVIDGFLALLALSFFLLLRKLVLRFVIPEHDETESPETLSPQASSTEPTRAPKQLDEPARDSRPTVSSQQPVTEPIYRNVPQDSVLRRHHISHVRYMIETISLPRPTETVLIRHYDQLISSQMEAALNDDTELQRLFARYEAHRRTQIGPNARTPKKLATASAQIHLRADNSSSIRENTTIGHWPEIPEDSVLRRHYLSHARYLLESLYGPCPTDSVLRRHHDHLIDSELEACLLDEERMQALMCSYEEQRKHF